MRGRSAFQVISDANRAGTATEVDRALRLRHQPDGRLHKVLCFRAWNQHYVGNIEIAPKKLLVTGDVLGGFALHAFVKVSPVMDPAQLGQFFFRVGIEIHLLLTQSVAEQDFRIEARGADSCLLQQSFALLKRRS